LRFGVAPAAALGAVEHGRADALLTPPPVSQLRALATRYASLLHTYPLPATDGLFLNTHVWPFSVLRARRAVNYAIDRNTMIALAGGPLAAQPTCQVLPPEMPGYQPYCPYTINPGPSGAWVAPDLARAKELVRASGTRGARVTVVTSAVSTGPPARSSGEYLVSVLRQLGYRASLRVIPDPHAYYRVVGNSRSRAQIGVFGWYEDFPAPSDFMVPLFSCRSFLRQNPANVNASEFCDPRIDAQMARARALEAGSPGAAARVWARVDHEITGQAPWAPLYNPRDLVVVAARVGNYQFHPFLALMLDQLWVR
jgi:peptide/nickel transport system substrate-binding protein